MVMVVVMVTNMAMARAIARARARTIVSARAVVELKINTKYPILRLRSYVA